MEKMPSSSKEMPSASDNQFHDRENDVFDISDLGGEKATDAKILHDSIKEERARKAEEKKNNLELDARDELQKELQQWEELRKMAELRIEASGVVQEVADETLSKKRLAELSESPKDTVARLRKKTGIPTAEEAAEDRMWKMKSEEANRRFDKFTKRDAADAAQPSATRYEDNEEIIELTDEDIEAVEEQKPEISEFEAKKNKKSPPPPPAIRRAA